MLKLARHSIILLTVVGMILTTFSDSADARRRRRKRHRGRRAPIINEKKLYERLGGAKRVGEIVDEWMRLNLADGRTATAFIGLTKAPKVLAHARKNLADHVCELADGPCQVKADLKNAKNSEETIHLDDQQFLVFGDNLFRSMQKFGTTEREKNELLGRIGEAKADFTGTTLDGKVNTKESDKNEDDDSDVD